MKTKVHVPILLVSFNRPEVIKESFSKIRDLEPLKLYVAVDGARSSIEGEKELVDLVRQIVSNVDWECEVHYKFNSDNFGAEITVSSAISWVLENEEYLIVLEDDIITSSSFFVFVQDMLEKYKFDERICMISGCNFTPLETKDGPDYFFSKYGHIGGWATWRRAWKYFNLYVNDFDHKLKYSFLREKFDSHAETKYFLENYQNKIKKGVGNLTWDFCWGYIYRTEGLLSIVPKDNLTSNIGVYGLHSNGRTEHHFRPFNENFSISKHPTSVERCVKYDLHHFNNYIKKSRKLKLSKVFMRLSKLFFNR